MSKVTRLEHFAIQAALGAGASVWGLGCAFDRSEYTIKAIGRSTTYDEYRKKYSKSKDDTTENMLDEYMGLQTQPIVVLKGDTPATTGSEVIKPSRLPLLLLGIFSALPRRRKR